MHVNILNIVRNKIWGPEYYSSEDLFSGHCPVRTAVRHRAVLLRHTVVSGGTVEVI